MLLVAALALSGACGGGGEDEESLIIARLVGVEQHLFERSLEDGTEKQLITAESRMALRDPAVSPNGERLAYVLQPPGGAIGTIRDISADIWVADRDGQNAHAAVVHDRPNLVFFQPQWIDDERLLVIARTAGDPSIAATLKFTLEEVDVNSGTTKTLVQDVLALGVSDDRSYIVYTTYNDEGESIHVALPDGTESREVVPVSRGFYFIRSPRFSPDGSRIAFGATETLLGRAHDAWPKSAAPPPAPSVHGAVEDIWIVDADTGGNETLIDVSVEEPQLIWHPDGDRLFALAKEGVYEIAVADGTSVRLGDGAEHTQMAFAD